MNLKSLIPPAVVKKASLAAMKFSQSSPKIFFVGGVAGMIGTTVLASRATLKVEGVLTETQFKLGQIKELQHDSYSETDRVKDRAIVLSRAIVSITKLYGPALILGTLSIAMLTKSHNLLTQRNAALAAAYVAVEKGFKEYRERVVKDLGEDADVKYSRGLESSEYVTMAENGETHVETKTTQTASTVYGQLFHDGNKNWQRVPEYNIIFLRGMQQMLNDQLRSKGYLFLNDVYDELGFDRTQAGCVVGWLADGDGDGYVDFGIFSNEVRLYEYVIGREGEIFLDFNVDGVIYDKFGGLK